MDYQTFILSILFILSKEWQGTVMAAPGGH